MKKFVLPLFVVLLVVGILGSVWAVSAIFFGAETKSETTSSIPKDDPDSPLISTTIVISQVYGGGGTTSGTPAYNADYVELKNISASPQSLNGLTLMYGSDTGNLGGSSGTLFFNLPNTTLQPGQFYLIKMQPTAVGGEIPIAADANANLSMGVSSGKVAITSGLAPNTCGSTSNPCTLPNAQIIDLVSYGSASNAEGAAAVPTLDNTKGAVRKENGCKDSDNNLADFDVIAPPIPRNTSSPVVTCAVGGNLQAALSANPTTVTPGSSTLINVTVIPATSPASTNISVTANLLSLAGLEIQELFDNGTNGDVTAGDNVYSFSITIPAGEDGGLRSISATASDAQDRSVNMTLNITINAPPPDDNPLIFGNPSGATSSVSNENNYLMIKPQYTLSYNRSRATANWVGWRIASIWLGSTSRQDDFRPDTTLPSGWYQVSGSDYSGSGYDRGHMCPSGDRTNTVSDNSATFLMTNMIPQLPANNQGPWAQFEEYSRDIVRQGNEVYVFSGVHGNIGTIAGGRVVVPATTWKVILVLPNGSNDLERVRRDTRAFGLVIPNQGSIVTTWRTYRKTVREVEELTGHDFFSLVPKAIQEVIERRADRL
jgi:DNA/RNA endonuclease G (NUC1)